MNRRQKIEAMLADDPLGGQEAEARTTVGSLGSEEFREDLLADLVIHTAAVIGDSGTPVEKTVSDFASTNPTGAFTKGQILVITVDYDGATGTAAQDLTVVVTTLEG